MTERDVSREGRSETAKKEKEDGELWGAWTEEGNKVLREEEGSGLQRAGPSYRGSSSQVLAFGCNAQSTEATVLTQRRALREWWANR